MCSKCLWVDFILRVSLPDDCRCSGCPRVSSGVLTCPRVSSGVLGCPRVSSGPRVPVWVVFGRCFINAIQFKEIQCSVVVFFREGIRQKEEYLSGLREATAYLKSCGVPDSPDHHTLPLHATKPEFDTESEDRLALSESERDDLHQRNRAIETEKADIQQRNQVLQIDLTATRKRLGFTCWI